MDELRTGRLLRALRRRRRLRQVDVGSAAGVSQSPVSLIERGHLSSVSLRVLRRVFAAVDARVDAAVSWRGGSVDSLLDERHARVVGACAQSLARLGWETQVEVTFNEYGERGSIDILGLRPTDGLALVVEIKTELTAIDDTIRRLDVKQRLVGGVVFDRYGWRPRTTSRLLVVLDTSTNRRRVSAHHGSLGTAFSDRGAAVRSWLRQPVGRLSGLSFSSGTNPRGTRRRDPRRAERSAAQRAPHTNRPGE
ncbi:MAG: helix-turn-helix domain-containing protein [Chloroflexota bacterium]